MLTGTMRRAYPACVDAREAHNAICAENGVRDKSAQ